MKKTKGTYEWVSKTFNIFEGCKYNCQYPCYARVIRRKKEEVWKNPIFKESWFNQKIENYQKGFLANCMCFSSHDIYQENQQKCLDFILRVLNESENTILITTKANIDTIKFLCEALRGYKERIKFMITITSKFDSISVKYEPEAPLISERILSLEFLNYHNWNFNISIEPFLDPNTIWLGCNSRKNYYFYTLKNLEVIQKYINDYYPIEKIFYKNSFIDKLEHLRNKVNKNHKEIKKMNNFKTLDFFTQK